MVFIIISFLFIIGISLISLNNKFSYIGAGICSIDVGIPDLFYVPKITDDMNNYFGEMKFLSPYNSFSKGLVALNQNDYYRRNGGNLISNFIMWAISKTQIFSLLPFITIFIIFLCVSISCVYQKINCYNFSYLDLLFCILGLFFSFQYYSASSTFRWALAVAVFLLGICIYCNSNIKCTNIIAYLLILSTYFIHEALILPILIFIFCVCVKKKRLNVFIFSLLIGISLFLFSILLRKNLTGFNSIGVLNIFYSYSENFYTFGIIFYIPIIIAFLYDIGTFVIIKNNKNIFSYFAYNAFYMFNISFLISAPISLIMLSRYYIFPIFISFLCYFKVKRCNGRISNVSKILYIIALILSIALFINNAVSMSFDFSSIKYY